MTTSMAELEGMLARLTLTMQELSESHKETERVLKESHKETERVLKESGAETDRRLAEISAEADKRSAEADKRMAKLERELAKTTKHMGGLHNSIGDIVEMVVIPGVMGKMSAFKHDFTKFLYREEFFKANGETLTEVDLLLKSCEAIMAVEVKSHLTVSRVHWHLERMRLLRKNERSTDMLGKTMYAAVAGISIDDDARKVAKAFGMYVISIGEDADRVTIAAPSEARVW